MLNTILQLLAPHDCVHCGREGSLLCTACASVMLPAVTRCYRCQTPQTSWRTCTACRAHTPLLMVTSAFAYKGAAQQLIHELKFNRARSAAKNAAQLLLPLLPDKPHVVTHLPTANGRIRERGFDQSRLIAQEIARQLPVSHYTALLGRFGHERQLGKNRQQRQAQLQNAFRPLRRAPIQATVILVDDVITTGGSLEAAAKVLRASGVKDIRAITFAQA